MSYAIFEEAARLIDWGEETHCCIAIAVAETGDPSWTSRLTNRFVDAAYDSTSEPLFANTGFWNLRPTPLRQQIRVLALLFAGEFYRTGDL